MESKLIAVRLAPKQLRKIELLTDATGMSQSELLRRLIDAARVPAPKITVEVEGAAPKGAALPNAV